MFWRLSSHAAAARGVQPHARLTAAILLQKAIKLRARAADI
jgi:hypothetical protein